MIISETPADERPAVPGVLAFALRHRYKLALMALAGIAAGAFGYSLAEPSYRSETVLVLDARRIQALSTDAVVSPLPQDSPALRSELDVIGSTSMAAEVVARLEKQGVEVPADNAGSDADAPAAVPAGTELDGKIERLVSGLSVTNDGRSYTIYIDYTDPDPRFSARVADAFAEAYIDHQADIQRNETRRVADWLGGKLDSLRQRLENSEKTAEDFRQKAGLTQAGGSTLQALRVTALQGELMNARADLAGAQARVDTARRLQNQGDVPALTEILASSSIQALRSRTTEAERKLSVIRASGASKSDQIPLLTGEIAASRTQIAAEIESVVDSLQSEVAVAEEKYSRISQALAAAQEKLGEASQDQVRLEQLEREAAANQAVYETYLQRYKQAIEQEGMVTPEARIISPASANTRKVGPRRVNWLALGLALGGGLGLAASFISDARRRRVPSPNELSRLTGLPVLGFIPKLSSSRRESTALDSRSEYGRAVSALNAALRGSHGEKRPQALALVSPRTGDGKTSMAVGLARALALSGQRVVVVDADTRRPRLAKAFGVRPPAFLDEILDGARPVSQFVCRDTQSAACIIGARRYAGPPEALLASSQFHALIADLMKRFDLVLIDTEALDRSSGALHAALAANEAILLARPDSTDPVRILAAAESLAGCGRRPLGLVINCYRGLQSSGRVEMTPQRTQEAAPQRPDMAASPAE